VWTILTDREVVQGVFCKVDNSNEVAERDDKNQTCCYAHQAVTVCCWDILNKRTQQWRRWTRSWQCRDCWKKRLWKTCQSKITGCCLFNVWAWTVCRVTIVKCVLKLCGLTVTYVVQPWNVISQTLLYRYVHRHYTPVQCMGIGSVHCTELTPFTAL